MQKNQFFYKCFRLSAIALLGCLVMLAVSSCSKVEKKSNDPTCVKLTKAQIENWVQKGYINPNDSSNIVRLRTAYGFPGTVFKVFAVIQKGDSVINESLTELTPVDSCNKKHIHLANFITTGIVLVNISDWNIWKGGKSQGKLIDSLQYIQFTPYNYVYSPFTILNYDASAVNKDGTHTADILLGKWPLPCPPCENCRPDACPTTCAVCGGVFIDSTKNITVDPVIKTPQ